MSRKPPPEPSATSKLAALNKVQGLLSSASLEIALMSGISAIFAIPIGLFSEFKVKSPETL